MLPILIIAAFIALYFRRYYYDRATGKKASLSLLIYSSKYFLPQQVKPEDGEEIKKMKKLGNVSLVVFYFLFVDAVLYGLIIGRMFSRLAFL